MSQPRGIHNDEAWFQAVVMAVSFSPSGFVVLLAREGDPRGLPIFVGPSEAQAIALPLEGQTFPRPLTHDLLHTILQLFNTRVERIRITRLVEGTFHARVDLRREGLDYEIDARPSDALALALRARAPIFVASSVWEEAATILDDAPPSSLEPVTPTDRASELRSRLDDAVRAERYEEAARLRDELRRLETDN